MPVFCVCCVCAHLQPENILMNLDKTRYTLADYGDACGKQGCDKWVACSLIYRPPELILVGDTRPADTKADTKAAASDTLNPISAKIDIWGVGCVLAEVLLKGEALFDGESCEDIAVQMLHHLKFAEIKDASVFSAVPATLLPSTGLPFASLLSSVPIATALRALVKSTSKSTTQATTRTLQQKLSALTADDADHCLLRDLLDLLWQLLSPSPLTRPTAAQALDHRAFCHLGSSTRASLVRIKRQVAALL